MNYNTLSPEAGGLFDYKLFGPGTVIDAPAVAPDEPVKPRKTQFARITLALPIVHPLFMTHALDEVAALAGWTSAEVLDARIETGTDRALVARLLASEQGKALVMTELPVLPPDLRPLRRLDDDRWATSPLNDLYRRVVNRNNRLARLLETDGTPPVILSSEHAMLAEAIEQLFENDEHPKPLLDSQGVPLQSLRGLCGGTLALYRAVQDLDARSPSDDALPGRLYLAQTVMFALGFELRS